MKLQRTAITAVFLPLTRVLAQVQKSNELLATRPLREKSSKPFGGQVGHKGTTLEMVSNSYSVTKTHHILK